MGNSVGSQVARLVAVAMALMGCVLLVPSETAGLAAEGASGPLDVSWVSQGPAPTVNGTTDYVEDASGRVTGLAADPSNPNVIYLAAAGGGVWKTTDGGLSWAPKTDGQLTSFMGAVAVAPSDPSIVYAGTGEANMGFSKALNFRDNIYAGRGLLKSSNGGDSWALLGSGPFDRRSISRIVVNPLDARVVYVAVGALATNGLIGNTGIWKSTDGGATWINTTTSISTTAAFSDLAIDPTSPATLYAAVGAPSGDPSNSVYKTTNAGATWALAGNFGTGASDPIIGRISLAIAPSAPQVLYAAIARSQPLPPSCSAACAYKLLQSNDGGNNWLAVTTPRSICLSGGSLVGYMASAGDYHNALAVDPADPNTVYAGGICLVVSNDGGNSWSALAQGDTDGPHRDHHALAFDSVGRLLDGNDGGAWRLEDPSVPTWTNLNTNLQITQLIGLALHPTDPNIAYAGTQDTGTVKAQGVPQWPRLQRGDGGASAVSSSNPNRVYQITRLTSTSPNIFRRSDNGGATWSIKVAGICNSDSLNFYPPLALDPGPGNSDRLLLGAARYQLTTGQSAMRVYETTDAGDTWSVMGTPSAPCPVADPSQIAQVTNVDALGLAPSDANTVYASTAGHLFVTNDRGVTWQQRDVVGLVEPHFRAFWVDPANAQTAYVVRDRFSGGHVFRTTNGGQQWTDISGNLPDVPTNSIVADPSTSPPTLYVGTDDGVYQSINLGGQWARFGVGLPSAQVVELKLNVGLNLLAAGTHGRGMWQTSLTGAANGVLPAASARQEPAVASGIRLAQPLTYTVEISNAEPHSVTGVVLDEPLPVGAELVSATPSQGSCIVRARSLVCQLGRLESRAVARVLIDVRVLPAAHLLAPHPSRVSVDPDFGGLRRAPLIVTRR